MTKRSDPQNSIGSRAKTVNSPVHKPDAENSMNENYIRIFDTTLRDGEQSPGASMNLEEKLRIAEVLEDMGVDVIEAGFPIASNGDFEAVREIAKLVEERRRLRPGPRLEQGYRPRGRSAERRQAARASIPSSPPARCI